MDDWYNYVGLAHRAGKVITGEDNIINHIRKNQVYLVVIAKDASANTKKKYKDKCAYYDVSSVEYGTVNDLSHAIGKSNRVAIGICDKGFSKGLLTKITK
ncbi:ribosomal L7Ae/L30e/S12e/Gadd45 family protein [Mycoplasmatota bacterium]|nr:ribosomal L7Ae/L30e/S12e/Gadd45 family protein [Mycoplasmatota bacterium]